MEPTTFRPHWMCSAYCQLARLETNEAVKQARGSSYDLDKESM